MMPGNQENEVDETSSATALVIVEDKKNNKGGRPKKESFVWTEHVDVNIVQQMLKSGHLSQSQYHSMHTMMDVAMKNNEQLQVEYSIEEGKYGRLKGKVLSRKQAYVYFSTVMPREMRDTLFGQRYWDVDMANAHINFANQLFKRCGFETSLIDRFSRKRKEMMSRMAESMDLPMADIKTLFIIWSYGGQETTPGGWLDKVGRTLDQLITSTRFPLVQFKKQYADNVKRLVHLPEYKYILDFARERRAAKKKSKLAMMASVENSAMAYLLQDIERHTIMALADCVLAEGRSIGGYAYDGLMIEKSGSEAKISEARLESWNSHVLAKTGFTITLAVKPMEVSDHLLQEVDTVSEDKDAAMKYIAAFKDKLCKSNGRVFVKTDHGIWTDEKETVKMTMIRQILTLNFYMVSEKQGAPLKPYSSNMSHARNCRECALALLNDDPGFISKLDKSSRGFLVYRNGIWDMANHCQVPRDEEHAVYSTIMIDRDLPVRDEALIEEVERKLWSMIVPDSENRAYFKRFLARGLAGDTVDKEFCICRGDRNCGKGILTAQCQLAFGDYIGVINSENFMFKASAASEPDISQKWMMKHEFSRLCMSQEISMNEGEKKKPIIDGNMVKRFTGNDVLVARGLYKESVKFRVQSRLVMFCNDVPEFSPKDVTQTMCFIDLPNRFVSAEEKLTGKCKDDPTVFARDDSIGEWLSIPEVADAFAWTLLDAYGGRMDAPKAMRDSKDELTEGIDPCDVLSTLFSITRDYNDKMTNEQIAYTAKGVNLSKFLIRKWLKKSGGADYRLGSTRGISGVKAVHKTESLVEAQDDDE